MSPYLKNIKDLKENKSFIPMVENIMENGMKILI
jgi:hypothetical protein